LIEQEELITRLQEQDTTATDLYRKIFVGAPILACFTYPFTAPVDFGIMTTMLCLSSLLYSAYALWTMPISTQQLLELDSGPVATHLPLLNSVLAGILVVGSLVKGNGVIVDSNFILSALPGREYKYHIKHCLV
jgi:hypothetical protein